FFQAEDGIRDRTVTGVQTCALPISESQAGQGDAELAGGQVQVQPLFDLQREPREEASLLRLRLEPARPRADRRELGGDEIPVQRSEERRVGKECRSRRWAAAYRIS